MKPAAPVTRIRIGASLRGLFTKLAPASSWVFCKELRKMVDECGTLSGIPAAASGQSGQAPGLGVRAMVKIAAVILAALGLQGSAPAKHADRLAQPLPAIFVSGHGWGHGIGMAQYGAYGYALHGWTFDRIVAHYYPGTTLGETDLRKVRVLLADRSKRVVI